MAVVQQSISSGIPEASVPLSLDTDRTLERISELGKSAITGAAAGVAVAAAVANALGSPLAMPGAIAGVILGGAVAAYLSSRYGQPRRGAKQSGTDDALSQPGR